MYQANRKSWYKHYDFTLIDLFCIELSYVLACILRFGGSNTQSSILHGEFVNEYQQNMLLILLIHLAIVLFTQPYSGILRRNSVSEIKKVLLYNVWMLSGMIVVLFLMHESGFYSRKVIVGFPILNCFFMFFSRHFYKKYLKKRINSEENQDCMLLVAPAAQISGILTLFYKNGYSTSKIVGILLTENIGSINEDEMDFKEVALTSEYNEERDSDMIRGIPVFDSLEAFYEYARTNIVDEVLICEEGEAIMEMANVLIDMGITIHIAVQSLVQLPKATVERVNGISVITSSVNRVTTKQLMAKRLVDIFFGLCGSVVTILLTLVIAPMIWIADPGPIFFRQERVGKNGRIFKIWKFRTMYTDAEDRKAELMKQNKMSGLMFKMDDDPRIIGAGKKFSLGKFLRESSLDELPQSFNILAGSMSVVGTRPPTVNEYKEYDLHHKGRLATKPGLTGMWQVSGRSDITDFEEVVRLDKEYIDNFSLSLDFEIILKTVKVVLGREGSV